MITETHLKAYYEENMYFEDGNTTKLYEKH